MGRRTKAGGAKKRPTRDAGAGSGPRAVIASSASRRSRSHGARGYVRAALDPDLKARAELEPRASRGKLTSSTRMRRAMIDRPALEPRVDASSAQLSLPIAN